MTPPTRVLIVDDSRIFRSLVKKALDGEEDIQVVGSVMNGVKAMEFIEGGGNPDVVSLDLEMPEMDGLQTLAAIDKYNQSHSGKGIGCVMVSALTEVGSKITIEALEAGAFDFITKPHGDDVAENQRTLKAEILDKVRCFVSHTSTPKAPRVSLDVRPVAEPKTRQGEIQAIVIGCSTGGPKALMTLLPELCSKVSQPILLVQHMPPHFTASLAESLNRKCQHEVLEAQGGEVIQPRHIYIAPGGRHMVIGKNAEGQLVTAMNDQPPENGCRPSVDVLFRSAAVQYGGHLVAVVLTGMGSDGTKGLAPLKRAGVHIVVQDEASSVVWGMPGSAVEAGRCDEIQPLENIATAVAKHFE